MSSTVNGTLDRKERLHSPNGSDGNVVDHLSPGGGSFVLEHFLVAYNITMQVTDHVEPVRRSVHEGKSHMINVQPLKRSEMQVRIGLLCSCQRYKMTVSD